MICVFGGKGAPGASTAALLFAALQPRGGVLVEADPAGGDAALRLSGPSGQILPAEPNLTRLAVSTPTDLLGSGLDTVLRCALQTSTGVPVVCGLTTGDGMTQTLARYAAPLAKRLGTLGDIVVDAGRLTPGSPALPLAASASAVVLVLADGGAYFYAARDLLAAALAEIGGGSVGPAMLAAVVCRPRRGRVAVRELDTVLAARGIPVAVAGWLAHDPRGLGRFLTGQAGARRSVLLRTATPVVAVVRSAAEHSDLPAARAFASSPEARASVRGQASSPLDGSGGRR